MYKTGPITDLTCGSHEQDHVTSIKQPNVSFYLPTSNISDIYSFILVQGHCFSEMWCDLYIESINTKYGKDLDSKMDTSIGGT